MSRIKDERPTRVRFGSFELDRRGEELLESGRPVKLARQPFKVLATLAERPGEIVSREELRAALWSGDTHVDFDSGLHSCIKQVRAALGDDASAPRFIETLPRRGYRFLPEIIRVPASKPGMASNRPAGLAVAAAALFAVALVATRPSHDREVSAPPGPVTLVVLPFTDDASVYRGPMLADEAVRRLGVLDPSRLAVLASSSAARLGGAATVKTDFVLTGSVSEDAIEAELTSGDAVLWHGHARDVSSLVAALVPNLLPEPRAAAPRSEPANADAYDAYLKGRYHLNRGERGGLDLAERYLRESLALDDAFADAHVALASVHNLRRRHAEAAREAKRALELGPSAEAHFALALARWYGDWDWAGAGESFQRALLANPGLATVHHWYGYYLTGLGRHEEAIEAIERALKLDPLSPQVQSDVGWFYYFAGRYAEACAACERTLELEPGFPLAESCILESRLALGERVEHRFRSEEPYTQAVWLLRDGDTSAAFGALERAVAEKSPWVPMLAVDPRFAALRSEPRYARLLETAGFR